MRVEQMGQNKRCGCDTLQAQLCVLQAFSEVTQTEFGGNG